MATAPFHYRCGACGAEYGRDEVRYLCPRPPCGGAWNPGEPLRGVLEAIFDYDEIRRRLRDRPGDLSPLCAVEPEFHPPLPVGNTPLFPAPRLGERIGLPGLLLKNDALNPSGSLKDRASHLVVAEAIRIGERSVVAASTGNAASALAAVCAATDRTATLFVPATAPRAKVAQMILHGARVILIDGTYDDAYRLSLEYTRERGGLNRNTAYHPLTIEGKKSVALEIFVQNGHRAPDAVVVPVGDGVILAAVHKGFVDLRRCGLIERPPRLVGVQAEGSDAIHRYVVTGRYEDARDPSTVADSISVRTPSNAHMARRAIAESGGFTVAVPDEAILEAQALLARAAGVFAEPAAAAPIAALAHMQGGRGGRGGRGAPPLDPAGGIVALITGHGLKDVEAALSRVTLPPAVAPTLEAIP